MKTAIVIGATGLVGKHLTVKLLSDNRYSTIKIFVRHSININNTKLEEYIVNFDEIDKWKDKIHGNELYSAMGTAIRKAKSKKLQYKIDVTYQYEFAKAAAENGVAGCFLVSSVGANPKSKIFYLKIKGELEEMVSTLYFEKIRIFRPSLLTGERDEKRFGEKAAESLLNIVAPIFPFLKNQRPIKGESVAAAMIKIANDAVEEKIKIYEPDDIFKMT